ncbi:FAD binding domain-containing protein [Actinacidiphila sp. ITFR-21]|uniref:FAD binding domain-containing protein n=1 Tax=Actinacidiphila sp. ITFR-21 TaxID=3075199 RepID=UPI002889251D|nr:FAD binding domain-containing protein [Streptomyces sp. ITFR-21]WNI15241.1 FAD binding domain-containing protein [Streptomyces sp. ITFR-21]
MDLNTVVEVCDARSHTEWREGDAWLGGGTYLFSEPQPHLRRLVDLSRTGWQPLARTADGGLEIAATCTIAQLSRYAAASAATAAPLFEQCCRAFLASWKIWNMATVGGNLCNALPAGPMISLTAALDGECLLIARDGRTRTVPAVDFVTGPGRTVLGRGELLRSVTLPARALAARTGFRQASLYGLGRSGVLVIGTLGAGSGNVGADAPGTEPPGAGGADTPGADTAGADTAGAGCGFALNVTASTVRPFQLRFARLPGAEELRAAVEREIAPVAYYDDIHGLPAWRRHMTARLAEEIRRDFDDPHDRHDRTGGTVR